MLTNSQRQSTSEKSQFRPDIQGLRGVAVLLVVIYHARSLGLQGGYVGVDIFYVISGYLITGLLLREIEGTGKLRFAEFYARRCRRLVPAAAIVLAATTGIAWSIYSPIELKQFTPAAVTAALYLSNFWFAFTSTDYLTEGTDSNPLLHTWSLGVEEQFYLVWPLLLLVVSWLGRADTLRPRLFRCFAAVAVLSLVLSVWLTFASQPWAFFGSPTRAWEFAAGAMIPLWKPKERLPGPLMPNLMAVAGVLMIVGAATLFTDRTAFPGIAAVVPVLGAALVIAAGHLSPATGASRLLGVGALRLVGDISYSLYLWHWPVFVFIAIEFPNAGWPSTLAGLAAAFFLAWLTYVLAENPVRFSRNLAANAYASIALAVLLIGATVGFAMTARSTARAALAMDPYKRYLAASEAIPRIYGDGCHADIFVVDPPACTFGDKDAAITVVLFGDSHAAQWYPALRKLAEHEGWRLVSLTKSGCPSISYSVILNMLERTYYECDQWRDRALAMIRDIQPAVTIIANSYRHAIRPVGEGGGLDADGWERATRQTLAALAGSSAATVFVKDTPWLPFNAPICLSRAAWRDMDPDQVCEFDPRSRTADAVFEIESASRAKSDAVFAIDMTGLICSSSRCTVERDGFVSYRDSHHLTTRYVEHIANALYARLRPAVEHARHVRAEQK